MKLYGCFYWFLLNFHFFRQQNLFILQNYHCLTCFVSLFPQKTLAQLCQSYMHECSQWLGGAGGSILEMSAVKEYRCCGTLWLYSSAVVQVYLTALSSFYFYSTANVLMSQANHTKPMMVLDPVSECFAKSFSQICRSYWDTSLSVLNSVTIERKWDKTFKFVVCPHNYELKDGFVFATKNYQDGLNWAIKVWKVHLKVIGKKEFRMTHMGFLFPKLTK